EPVPPRVPVEAQRHRGPLLGQAGPHQQPELPLQLPSSRYITAHETPSWGLGCCVHSLNQRRVGEGVSEPPDGQRSRLILNRNRRQAADLRERKEWTMTVQALIPAAGAGLRNGESSANVLLSVNGRSAIGLTLQAFDRCDEITGI